MKVHIISENPSDAEFAEQAISFEAVTGPPDSTPDVGEGEVVVFDYALGKKRILENIDSSSGAIFVVFYDDIKSKDQRDMEGADSPPHALLKRPVTEDFFMDVISDFVDCAQEDGPTNERTRTNSGLADLTFIGQKKKQKTEEKESPAQSQENEDDADFDLRQPMQEFKMSGEIKEIIKKHSLSPDRTPAFNSPENQNIQRKFDLVFPDASIPRSEAKEVKLQPIDEELLHGISEDIKPIDGASLDLDGMVEDLTASKKDLLSVEETVTESEEVISTPHKKEQPIKADKAPKPEGSMTQQKTDQKEDASLMFDLGADLDKELVGDAKPAEKSTSTATPAAGKDDLGLGDLDLNFSIDATETEAQTEEKSSTPGESVDLPSADNLELGNDEAQSTTVFKGKSVELGGMDLPDGDDLVLDTLSDDEKPEKKETAAENIEFDSPGKAEPSKTSAKAKAEDKKADDLDLDLDLDMADEGPTKVATEDISDEPIQEFDYKSAVKTNTKLPEAEDDLDIDLDDDLQSEAVAASSSELDDIINVEEDEEDDAPTRILTANKREESNNKKPVEVIDVSEGEDDGPMIIGTEKIPTASLNENDLVRLQATIRHLKGERENLLKEVESLKDQKREIAQENIGLRAEIDDLKIEISIIRKRHDKEADQTKEQLLLHEERKTMYEEKLKQYQKEIERLNHKLRVDFTKVKQREKELESQLELQAMDSENQIKSRDKKILELKRKIDSLEFNMENASIREQKFREDKDKIEERMSKIIHTLRNSINVLEDDLDLDEETLEKIKKV
ncbi:MAG: hypothetical protein HYV97_00315 [Bdellovibrio sp.]|nr:hypothetical protein [Bdellovibrio sp.]